MRIKERIKNFGDEVFEWRFLLMLMVLIAFSSLFRLGLFRLRFFQKEEKKKVTKLRRDKLAHCLSCGEALYLELDREKQFVDDWESNCRYCLNEDCENYGKAVITVYNPDTFVPYTPRVREENKPIMLKNDSRIEIVN